jgi:hypothetical protein
VLAVYPWLGLLRTGIVDEPLHVLDRCRTTPGVVEAVVGDELRVLLQPLRWDGRLLELGAPISRLVRWREDGLGMIDDPRCGDLVSLHWDFACDRLTAKAAASLARATRNALTAVNRSSSTARALA